MVPVKAFWENQDKDFFKRNWCFREEMGQVYWFSRSSRWTMNSILLCKYFVLYWLPYFWSPPVHISQRCARCTIIRRYYVSFNNCIVQVLKNTESERLLVFAKKAIELIYHTLHNSFLLVIPSNVINIVFTRDAISCIDVINMNTRLQ